ncbi:FAD-dependent oxidoreductase [Xenophilus arseniciresistens]|uniref:FAD-dependent oxidoreductase n=1 Tax=Xenophilus arseniciresistens TaxID=1283306 RepID=A0AAE3NE37_9BURK|nr:FAD-dependent oxidoreductase [Xenophilus arseniciresistens]MDA7418587.1 FAD-dependent oxidoreductase [Xenophilus arseniciresistens]
MAFHTPHEVFAPYDPAYDPLVSEGPGRNRDYAPTWWAASAGTPPDDDGPITQDTDADVVIIGSGFTGLATALFLAREHGIKATVLEANRVAWGCTSRNGGQGQNASGRLYRSQWIARWGLDVAKKLDAEIRWGFETFSDLVKQVDCDAAPGGHLFVAHREKKMAFLRAETEVMRKHFGYDARMLSREEVLNDWCGDQDAKGAQYESEGISVHPLKLAHGYLKMARELGVKVHPASPVTAWVTKNGVHHLRTPGGEVRARAVGIATGAYTAPGLHGSLKNRYFPVLSNCMVTRPLTDAELAATNFKTKIAITDTRTLRFYYRLLAGNRLQIGSRSSITGADAHRDSHYELLTKGIARKFPALAGIQIDHSWWGWVDVSHDMMPRVWQPDAKQQVFYALGYGGNGVSFSAHAGRRMAQRIAGQPDPLFGQLPIYRDALPFPAQGEWAAPFRRLGQSALYKWYWLRDEVL